MPPRFAARALAIEPFLAMEVMERAFAMQRAGVDIVHLEIGEPDFAPPPAAVEACVAALRSGETHYTDSRGLVELREAIAEDHARRFGTSVDPDHVLVTSGTSAAMRWLRAFDTTAWPARASRSSASPATDESRPENRTRERKGASRVVTVSPPTASGSALARRQVAASR